jgi:hypothetical protein
MVRWIIPAQLVPPVQCLVLSVQPARSVREAVLLVNGQASGSIPLTGSQVRGGKALYASRFVERTSSAGLPDGAPAVVTDGGGDSMRHLVATVRGAAYSCCLSKAAVSNLSLFWALCECVDFRTEQDVKISSHQAM